MLNNYISAKNLIIASYFTDNYYIYLKPASFQLHTSFYFGIMSRFTMKRNIEVSSLCTGQDGVKAGGEGATEVNNSTSAEMGKALSIISMLQKNTGQDVMDLTEDDLLLLTDFKRRLGRGGQINANGISQESLNRHIN